MTARPAPAHGEEPPRDPTLPADILIGRVVDGVADPDDLQQFRAMFAVDDEFQRAFAERYHDAAALAIAVDREIEPALRVRLPETASREQLQGSSRGLAFAGAFTGWAASIALALVWAFGGFESVAPASATVISPEYRQHVIVDDATGRELDPVWLGTEIRPDGQIEVTYMKRPIYRAVFGPEDWNPDWVRSQLETDQPDLPDS